MNLIPFKPSIKFKAKSLRYAIYARVVSVIGGVMAIVFSLDIVRVSPAASILMLISGLLVIIIEIDLIPIQFLKISLNRGVVFVILGVFSTFIRGYAAIAGIILIIGGVLYLYYFYD